MIPDFNEENTVNSYYPHIDDIAFTPDEVRVIELKKAELDKVRISNNKLTKIHESLFWGISSYSLVRFLILTRGEPAIGLALTATIVINQIANRDLLEGIVINRIDGKNDVSGIDKMIRMGFSLCLSAFTFWNAAGDYISLSRVSESSYANLQSRVEEFNRRQDDTDYRWLIPSAVIIVAALAGVASHAKNKKSVTEEIK